MTKPFSYDVPVSSFGQVEEMWDADGKMLAKLSDRPINLGVQDDTQPPADPPAAGGGRGGANQKGKRDMAWRPDGQGLHVSRAGAAAGRSGRGRWPRPAGSRRSAGGAVRVIQPTRNKAVARALRSARIASISGCRRSTTPARR